MDNLFLILFVVTYIWAALPIFFDLRRKYLGNLYAFVQAALWPHAAFSAIFKSKD